MNYRHSLGRRHQIVRQIYKSIHIIKRKSLSLIYSMMPKIRNMQPFILTFINIYCRLWAAVVFSLWVFISFIAVVSVRACVCENIHGCIYFSMETTSIPLWNSHSRGKERKYLCKLSGLRKKWLSHESHHGKRGEQALAEIFNLSVIFLGANRADSRSRRAAGSPTLVLISSLLSSRNATHLFQGLYV